MAKRAAWTSVFTGRALAVALAVGAVNEWGVPLPHPVIAACGAVFLASLFIFLTIGYGSMLLRWIAKLMSRFATPEPEVLPPCRCELIGLRKGAPCVIGRCPRRDFPTLGAWAALEAAGRLSDRESYAMWLELEAEARREWWTQPEDRAA